MLMRNSSRSSSVVRRLRRAFVAGLALAALVSAFAKPASAQLKSITPNSCWGNCGYFATDSSNVISCACDSSCETYGDCCPDKSDFCAVDTVGGSTKYLCPFLQNSGIYGTDLGFNFQQGNTVNVLFGDTWQCSTTDSCGSSR
jgi:hypothetical protein